MSNKIIDHKFREILFPTLLIVMTINLTSMADLVFVAHFIGHNGQAALQVFEPLVMLTTIFEWLFGLGGQILSLNRKAEFDEVGSNHYFTAALLTTAKTWTQPKCPLTEKWIKRTWYTCTMGSYSAIKGVN